MRALEVIRWVALLVAIFNLAWMLIRASMLWDKYTGTGRRLATVLMMFLFTTIYGTGETIAQGAPIGFRSVLSFLTQAGLLVVLLRTRGDSMFNQSYRDTPAA